MKKCVILSIILILILTAGVLAGCTAYNGKVIENPDDIISGVKQMTISDYKTQYFLGEELDYSKMTVKLLLENGAIKVLNVAENPKTLTVSGYDRFQEGQQTVVVKYGGKVSVSYQVTVLVPEISGISLSKLPDKLLYTVGDRLDMSGAEMTITQTNGNVIVFSVTNDIVFSQYFTNDREKQFAIPGIALELSVRYGSRNILFNVDVMPRRIVSIGVAKSPTKTSYFVGTGTFVPDGMLLTYTYNNGTTEVIPAETQSELKYVFDFSKANLKSPVQVLYVQDQQTLFSTSLTVQVYEAGFKSIRIIKTPDSIDSLIEGFSEIKYSTGLVEVTFEDNTTRQYAMDDENITHGKFDNTQVGVQTVLIGYRNSSRNVAELTVTVQPKKVNRIEFFGQDEIASQHYYEGQNAEISIAKLFYVAHYNNETKTERLEVVPSMLKAGVNLSAVSDINTPGIKRLAFIIEGKEAGFEVTIIPRAVASIEIVSQPTNLYIVSGTIPKRGGGQINVFYNNQNTETLPMDSNRVSLEYDTTVGVGNQTEVRVYCDKTTDTAPYASYFVSVVSLDVVSMSINARPTKTNYTFGEEVDFSGLQMTLTLTDLSTLTLGVLKEEIEDGIRYIYFNNVNDSTAAPIKLVKTDFCSKKSTLMTATGNYEIDFYGAKATFHTVVSLRLLTGIYVYSTQNVTTELRLGDPYPGIVGLSVKMVYSEGTYDIVTISQAQQVSNTTQITSSGWFWYFGSSENTLGETLIYVVYSDNTGTQQSIMYSASYHIVRQDADMMFIEGLYRLKDNQYEKVFNLGSQPKGLTPYLGDYYLGVMYTDDELRYVSISAAMTNYDIKDHTEGTRPIIIWFGEESFSTTIMVDLADLISVDIGLRPRMVYIYTETLNLDGGTLIRNFNVDASSGIVRQDSVEMKEARVSYPERAWPAESDFGGAAFLEIAVVLTYEDHEVGFSVKVYQKQDLKVRVTNNISYYANVLPPTAEFIKEIADFDFPFPKYVQSYEYANGTPYVSESSMINGNIIYDSPKLVGDYLVVIRSDGNDYYNKTELRETLTISKLAVELSPNKIEKTYGDADPTLTYTVDSEAWNEVSHLLNQNAQLTRQEGEDVGVYQVGDFNNSFTGEVHPYFDIKVLNDVGRLTVRPRLFQVELKSNILYYQQDGNGDPIDLLDTVEYTIGFIEVVDGARTVVTEDIWSKEGYVNHEKYSGYAALLNDPSVYQKRVFTRKLGTETWTENGEITQQNRYEIKIEYSVVAGAQNLRLENQENPGAEATQQILRLDVKLQPWQSPAFTSENYVRIEDVTETDLDKLELIVNQVAQGNSFEFVVTKNYVYLWNYRPSTWAQNPAGKWLAYQTVLTPGKWVGVDTSISQFDGYRIAKSDLNIENGRAIIRLKFVSNGVDRADSQEYPYFLML